MNIIKTLLYTTSLFCVMIFVQCTSVKNIEVQEKVSFEISQIYFQNWVAGLEGGGSGMHMYIFVSSNKSHVVFDSVYFKGSRAKIQISKMGYIANFNTELNQKQDLVMSNDENAEYGNELPNLRVNSPVELKDNECLISYIEKGETKYYKFTKVVERQAEYLPSAPPKN